MKIGTFDTEKEVFVIAEIGNNHEGNFEHAVRLIRLAAKAGAHAVKFQTFRTELYVSPKDQARFQRLKGFEFSFEQFGRLAHIANEEGIFFLSTPFDLESAGFLESLVPAYKIASGDNTFFPLLEKVAQTGKPVILSGGLLDKQQLLHSKAFIETIWRDRTIAPGFAVLHCVTSYPVVPEQANLLAIKSLKEELGGTIGYSDHTLGINAAVLAVAIGAQIIEKHFTSDKHYSEFRDHQISADFEDFVLMMQKIKETIQYLGNGRKVPQQGELANLQAVRRSIVACRPLEKGTVLSMEDITWIRPGGGIAPGNEKQILGKKLNRSLDTAERILLEDLYE